MSFPSSSFFSKLLVLGFTAVLLYSAGACGTGKNPPRTLIGIFIHPGNTTAYSNSAQSQVVYSVVAGYVGGDDVPLTSGVQWEVLSTWVSFDSVSSTATCKQPAPPDNFLFPTAASVKATATLEGKTFSDTALLYCL
ncbi:MAG TPA: hypothetical protein VE377_22690 [Candidatus Dormibacteraeota bacterium]|nr:hypothetical protein [Candidatus Dormibacteraeota bacterium]